MTVDHLERFRAALGCRWRDLIRGLDQPAPAGRRPDPPDGLSPDTGPPTDFPAGGTGTPVLVDFMVRTFHNRKTQALRRVRGGGRLPGQVQRMDRADRLRSGTGRAADGTGRGEVAAGAGEKNRLSKARAVVNPRA